MNDIEVFLMLGGVGIASFVGGRYWRDYVYRAKLATNNETWTTRFNLLRTQCDWLILFDYRQREALTFYADAKNWMDGSATKDGGDIARAAISDLRIATKRNAA